MGSCWPRMTQGHVRRTKLPASCIIFQGPAANSVLKGDPCRECEEKEEGRAKQLPPWERAVRLVIAERQKGWGQLCFSPAAVTAHSVTKQHSHGDGH